MNESDIINGIFEFIAGTFHLLNVKAILKDKMVKGFSPLPIAFFTSWGLWNLFFYPWNGLWWSFWGGVWLVGVNILYLYLIWKYKNNDKNPK